MPMKRSSLAATVFAAAVCLSAPAFADGMPYRGSVKDAPIPVSAGPCYFRGDVGYSWSNDPDVRWTVDRSRVHLRPVRHRPASRASASTTPGSARSVSAAAPARAASAAS